MTDVLTKKQRSYNMSQIRAKNTKPEIKFLKLLSSRGIKNYKIHYSSLPGKPDIVFIKNRVAIFIDGCFWHKCPTCFIQPRTRIKFWMKKIRENLQRDRKVNKELKNKGWSVIRIREHDVERNSEQIFLKLLKILRHKLHRIPISLHIGS